MHVTHVGGHPWKPEALDSPEPPDMSAAIECRPSEKQCVLLPLLSRTDPGFETGRHEARASLQPPASQETEDSLELVFICLCFVLLGVMCIVFKSMCSVAVYM